MSLESGFCDYLAAKSAITGIVSARIYPLLVPQAKGTEVLYPAISFQRISASHIHSMSGSSELCFARLQVNSWARTHVAAWNLAEQLRLALDGATGTWGASTEIQSCLLGGERDTLDESPGNDAQRIFGVMQDYMISFYEVPPTL